MSIVTNALQDVAGDLLQVSDANRMRISILSTMTGLHIPGTNLLSVCCVSTLRACIVSACLVPAHVRFALGGTHMQGSN